MAGQFKNSNTLFVDRWLVTKIEKANSDNVYLVEDVANKHTAPRAFHDLEKVKQEFPQIANALERL